MQSLRSCQFPMITYAARTRIDAPVARPSRPSVRFTPLEVAVTMTSTQITNSTVPIETPKSLRNEMCVEAGVRS